MKKLLVIAAIALSAAFTTASAQGNKAAEVVNKFMTESKINTITDFENFCYMIDMVQEQQGMSIPMKVIIKQPGNKLKAEVSQMGMDILMVSNGEKAWAKMAGQVQEIPLEQVQSITGMASMVKGFVISENDFELALISEDNNSYSIGVTPKEGGDVNTIIFNKKTGLMDTIIAKADGTEVVTTLSDYKTFNGITLPSVMEIKMGEQVVSKMVINDFNANYPAVDFIFAEPK